MKYKSMEPEASVHGTLIAVFISTGLNAYLMWYLNMHIFTTIIISTTLFFIVCALVDYLEKHIKFSNKIISWKWIVSLVLLIFMIFSVLVT